MADMADLGFWLPPGMIAQEPPKERGDSRLMVLSRSGERIALARFADLGRFMPKGSLLVLNEAKVTPARLLGTGQGGGKAEALILAPPGPGSGPGLYALKALVKPARRFSPGKRLFFANEEFVLEGEVLAAGQGGERLLQLDFPGPPLEVLESLGHVPLPPYIKRPDRPADRDRYQTVYAAKPGAVAAPTAGLHFTQAHLAKLEGEGVRLAKIFLKVGAGTFAPLTERDMESGTLKEEDYEASHEAIEAVAQAKANGQSVIAVGTTSARALEWIFKDGRPTAGAGRTNLFIRPGHKFRAVDSLITNFHLPGTSLLLLVAALAGQELIKKAYALAIDEGFRFYSYGDAMLIL
jgi:S-adenosylmethionine:tRNA ribosyltransferase-isomerase